MIEDTKKTKPNRQLHITDYLANERTFLAWVRTSIGIMAFGFVVEKFSYFIKQITLIFNKEASSILTTQPFIQNHSSLFGIILVSFGCVICLCSFFQYLHVKKKIDEESYQPSLILNIILTLFVLFVGILLVFYLNVTIL